MGGDLRVDAGLYLLQRRFFVNQNPVVDLPIVVVLVLSVGFADFRRVHD